MTMSTDQDIQEYMPDLHEYGIQDFSAEHEKSRQDIFRRLRIEWWPKFRPYSSELAILSMTLTRPEMDETLLTESQFTRAAVFHVLSYYILPKLMKFDPEGDRFGNMQEHYRARFEEEFNLVLKDGVEYDFNDDGIIDSGEKAATHFMRLVR
jgi:hypothetical protein